MIRELDIQIVNALQQFHPQLDGMMALFATLIKAEIFIVFLIPLLYWLTSPRLFFRVFVAILLDLALGEALRVVFAQPRPWWVADLVALDPVTSIYSSPGGYTSTGLILYGYVVYHINKGWAWPVAIGLVLLTSVAKMYQAAMFPSHMVLGALQGGLMLYLLIRFEECLVTGFVALSPKRVKLVALCTLGAILYGLTVLAMVLHSTYSLPAEWVRFAVLPSLRLSSGGSVFAIGLLTGGLIGYHRVMANGGLRFSEWRWPWRVGLGLVGLIILLVLFMGVRQGLIGISDSHIWAAIVNLSLSGLSGYWVMYGAPRVLASGRWILIRKV